ncbi:2-amino-4-hydroxy-6-hydroxymethyldihydropteridine diphosphokinase [Alteromonas aestuariivivens]|uniref:2-amino-4-hydroxy-6-hydroxymethyldihydropteridine pyrophosphokinase n=1 Tax=Alteromonas aestuariivivens TaxID=1938339 RepID=A0A3D8M3S5_9ALTE|nr:2-amino-4-hydroxy-6-hydroxymethyldihydropteridine diphosphokinase [Alteromonas aestuariivivens]RDV24205.1 2-amino-4-hydroxy-6-hydroxymethyldihydropteridine diphosphokinase [Alteromonas aestuariivivens]
MPTHKEQVYIGLGSNLGDSREHLRTALSELDSIESTRRLRTSSFYSSSPMGPQNQADFINAVCLLETTLPPHDLLAQLQGIENHHGRERKDERWGPRTLDLDILLYGNHTVATDDLTIPHYGLAEREFVLVPLFEIAPNMVMPDGKPLSNWVAKCSLDGLRRLRSSNQR